MNDTRKHTKKCPAFSNENVHQCRCDGFHTFEELYEHRHRLFIQLCKERQYRNNVWCSVRHSDGTQYQDWFILGIYMNKGKQITYHLPARFWNEVCEFAEVLETAPEYDGHTPDDVIFRLSKLSATSPEVNV